MPEQRAFDDIAHLDFPTPCMSCLDRGDEVPAAFDWTIHGGCAHTVLCTYCSGAIEARYRLLLQRYHHCVCWKCGALLHTFDELITIERIQ